MCEINRRRIKTAAAFFAVFILLLVIRLWHIQVVHHSDFEAAALTQYEVAVEGLDTRGMIFDRNLKPLTGSSKQYYYIISRKPYPNYVFRSESYNAEMDAFLREECGAYTFESRTRYSDEQLACHLIGYLNEDEKRGVSGLELMFQNELRADGTGLNVRADAAGNILKGEAPASVRRAATSKRMRPHSIITTIDSDLQRVCERALAGAGEGGAAVIIDAQSGEILTWASAPTFNPNRIEDYLKQGGDRLIDKVCQGAYAPGSVFKLITAAAALESGVCDENQIFECNGEVVIEGVPLKCTAGPRGGHGKLNMTEAMACSCNCYFAQLAELTGCGVIVETAQKFGLGNKVFKNFPQETAGSIPTADSVMPWDTTNLSIGQGEILATPLQIARMTAIIAESGKAVDASLLYGTQKRTTEKSFQKVQPASFKA